MQLSRIVGPLTVIALDEAHGPHFDRREDALPEATPDDWAAADLLDPAALAPDGRWWLRFWTYAIRSGDGPVTLVDAGIGPAGSLASHWAPVPGRLPAELAAAGIAPADVETIVLTHLHEDHIGWAVPAVTPFPNARVIAQRADVTAFAARPQEDALLRPLRESGRLTVLDGDAELGPGLRVIATPGHTPGHQSVLVSADDDDLLITGDLLVHTVQLLRPEVAYAYDMDAEQARTTRLSMLYSRGELAVSHLGTPFTSTGNE
ncbi:MAG TPA: MBL fold metallo-hydrolase [Actinoplanes sp.]|nr:MBL fold metallo-hydrolase [Actinoplanes sp.]